MVITRTLEGGEVAFQAGHQAFLGALVENHTRVFQTDGTCRTSPSIAGSSKCTATRPRCRSCRTPPSCRQDIDVERAKEALERHRLILKQEADEEALTHALAGKARAEARLTAAGSSFTA